MEVTPGVGWFVGLFVWRWWNRPKTGGRVQEAEIVFGSDEDGQDEGQDKDRMKDNTVRGG